MRVRQLTDLMRAVDAVQHATSYATTVDEIRRHLNPTSLNKANLERLADALHSLHRAAKEMREVEL